MVKETKKGYKRRKVIIGICVFASLSLIGTGFAAWVISTNNSTKTDGNIEIGDVKDSSVNFYDTALSATNIKFEPQSTDTSGRVRYDGTNAEVLSTTLTFKIDNYTKSSGVNVSLTLPAGFQTAVTDNYIVLPACGATDGININWASDTSGATVSDAAKKADNTAITEGKSVSYTITFAWGTAFNSMNPGLYYDTDTTGKAVTDDAMKTTLTALHNCITAIGAMSVNLKANINQSLIVSSQQETASQIYSKKKLVY